ncbi:M48 family metalloprotease [Hellea sp.]|nr:M48 family metalloprotease [Hellea sp.]
MRRALLCLAALSVSVPAWTADAWAADYIPRTENERAFAQILEEHQSYNERLQEVAAPLFKANARLCPRTRRDIGMTVHTISDYQPSLQPFAEVLMGATDRLSVRTIRKDSPADNAGLRVGDKIIGINGAYMPGGFTVQRFFKVATQNAFKQDSTELKVMRGDKRMDIKVGPETICDYPANVFFNQKINGHTDGEQIIITSELMKTVPDDVNLALIIAHEMSHAIKGHQRKEKALELKADRMALVLMSNAGYDIDRAISYWRESSHPHAEYQTTSKTHPTIDERYENFRKEQARIEKLKAAGKTIRFN